MSEVLITESGQRQGDHRTAKHHKMFLLYRLETKCLRRPRKDRVLKNYIKITPLVCTVEAAAVETGMLRYLLLSPSQRSHTRG